MDHFEEYGDEQVSGLIEKFDAMLKQGAHYFFDVEEFEVIIDHYLFNNQLEKSGFAIKYAMEQYPRLSSFMLNSSLEICSPV